MNNTSCVSGLARTPNGFLHACCCNTNIAAEGLCVPAARCTETDPFAAPAHGLHAGAAEAALCGAAGLVAGHDSPLYCLRTFLAPRKATQRLCPLCLSPVESSAGAANMAMDTRPAADVPRGVLDGSSAGSTSRSILRRCWPRSTGNKNDPQVRPRGSCEAAAMSRASWIGCTAANEVLHLHCKFWAL